MDNVRPFEAIAGASVRVNNSATATAQLILPPNSDTVVLTNNSSTATAYYRVTPYLDQPAPPADAASNAPTTTTDMPVPPQAQIRVFVGQQGEPKFIRFIASAADSYVTVTPGKGI